MQQLGHWPKVKGGEWKALYQSMFGEELKPGTEVHRKIKKDIENARAKYHKDHPKALE